MNKTEILNIVNEPSKHIHIVKIDGKDSIVYSSKFVELLELIPTMYTKDEVIDMLEELQLEISESTVENEEYRNSHVQSGIRLGKHLSKVIIQDKINALKGANNE